MTLQATLDKIVVAESRHRDVHEIALAVLEGDILTHACRGDWQGKACRARDAVPDRLDLEAVHHYDNLSACGRRTVDS